MGLFADHSHPAFSITSRWKSLTLTMALRLSVTADAAARLAIDRRTSGSSPQIPGIVYCAVDKTGNIVFQHASGQTGLNQKPPMTMDTTFWLASCTKLITSIACMQLVEQGKLALDDSVQLELLAPELKRVRVLERDENNGFRLNRKERSITLRMLLNHTCKKTPNPSCHFTLTLKFHVRPIIAGFGYAFEDIKLRDWSRPVGIDDFSGNPNDVLHGPLVSQPGTKFQYGVGLDWVGTLVERVTGLSLEEYFQTFILRPLDIKSITFFPCKESKATVAYMHSRTADGTLSIRDHLYRYPLLPYNPQEYHFCMGGAGCFGKPVEYCRASMLHALRVCLIC